MAVLGSSIAVIDVPNVLHTYLWFLKACAYFLSLLFSKGVM